LVYTRLQSKIATDHADWQPDGSDLQPCPRKCRKAVTEKRHGFLYCHMSTKYKATAADEAYFITITTIGWVDVFTRLNQKQLIIAALSHCQKHKGLEIYAYCLMSSHLHILCKAAENKILSDIIRDFKAYTSKQILRNIIDRPERPMARICNPCYTVPQAIGLRN
jgi:REP element-mobilizing transposase RayT